MDERRNDNGNSNYSLKEVRDHHKEIIRRLILGQRPVEIAEALGCHKQTVSNVRNDPTVSAIIETLQTNRDDKTADIVREIQEVAPDAIRLMKQAINFGKLAQEGPEAVDALTAVPDVSEQIRAASKVLDIAVPSHNIEEKRHVFTGDLIESVKRRSLEAQKKKEEYEEANYEEIPDDTD